MTEERNDEIKEAAKKYAKGYKKNKLIAVPSFIQGAKWADEHPKNISMNYLHSWYQCSVDETKLNYDYI